MSTETKGATLASALVAAQADMPAVQPDSTNPHFRSRFVSLGHLIAKTRPVLNKHGLTMSQWPSAHPDTGAPLLITVLMHESGERIEHAAPLLLSKQDPQGLGSALTYLKRYAWAAALGISDQEDDDGNAGSAAETNGKPAEEKSSEVKAEPKPPTDRSTAGALFSAAQAAKIDGQKLSMYLSSVGVVHDPITSKASAVSALQRLPEDKVDGCWQWMSEGQSGPVETADVEAAETAA